MASIGKSTFLDYILGWVAAIGHRVIYWANQNLFLFDGPNIYHKDTSSAQPVRFSASYHDAIFLVDSVEPMGKHQLPLRLMQDPHLFIIQAASPNPAHKEWRKKRPYIREFVLNPPEEDEMIQASGLFSLFFPLTLTGPDFRLGLHGFTIAKDIKSAIKDYGYNMRTLLDVLRGNSAVVDGIIELRLTTLDLATFQRMLETDIEARTSGSLITSLCSQRPDQTDSGYLNSDTTSRTFAGAVLYKALLRRHGCSV